MENPTIDGLLDSSAFEKGPLEWASFFTRKIMESVAASIEDGNLLDDVLERLEKALTFVHEVSSNIPNTTSLAVSAVKKIVTHIIKSRKKNRLSATENT